MIPRKEVQEEHILVPSWREIEINMSHKSSTRSRHKFCKSSRINEEE